MISCKRICRLALVALVCCSMSHASNDKFWQAVERALHYGLPKTALGNLDSILTHAQKEKQYNEWLQALSQKVAIEASIYGDKPEEKVRRLKAEFVHADTQTRPLLQTVLAQWYWQYFNRNRWRFISRTATERLQEDDFTTWDLPKIFRQIDSLYQNILARKDRLTTIETQRFMGFLEPGSMPSDLRPTLYDFIAHEALGFYTSAEQAATKAEDAFEIIDTSDALAQADLFLRFAPATNDTSSPKYKALKLYQSLMAYHQAKQDAEAFLDLDIERLNYVKNVAVGEETNRIFIRQLSQLVETQSAYPVSSLGAYYLARARGGDGDLFDAYATAKKGYENHPESIGGEWCRNYMIELKEKTLTVTAERSVPPGPSTVRISYKNFRKIYFKINADAWDDFGGKENGILYAIDSIRIRKLLGSEPAAEWEADLPATDSLREKTLALDIPKLKPGYYRIFASWQPDFYNSPMVQHTWFWVCSYTLVTRTNPGFIDGLVLDAVSGEPIEGVDVSQMMSKAPYQFGRSTRTDDRGYFMFRTKNSGHWHLLITKENERLLESDHVYAYGRSSESPDDRVIFFTDRSLYRPGQTVFFKGICVHIDRALGNYRMIPGRTVAIDFNDVNSQKVATVSLQTNDFGSFSGQFTTPLDRLAGSMTLSSNNPYGYASIRVEEYKRPKFTVALEAPGHPAKLHQQVDIHGKALAYTGAPMNGASVRYSVVRNASYPSWRSWYVHRSYYSSPSQQMAHGKITTDTAGGFTITFLAKPDAKVSADEDPTFTYAIHADVTSPDGETRSGDVSVRLGYSALSVDLWAGETLVDGKAFPLTVKTLSLDGNPLPADAQVAIHRLRQPLQPHPAGLLHDYWNRGDIEEPAGEFGQEWKEWPAGELVYTGNVDTRSSNPETLSVNLPRGLYRAECTSKDPSGREVRSLLAFMVLPDWDSKVFGIKLPFVAHVRSSTVAVGENLEAVWGTGYDRGRCLIEIEHDGTIVKSFWTDQDRTQQSLEFPVTEEMRGGIFLHFTQVRENRAYLTTIPISVPWDNKKLRVSIETFRDKITPGAQETMTLKITGQKAGISEAEMVATLYDFSLDQLYPHTWPGFDFFKHAFSQRRSAFVNQPQRFNTWHDNWNEPFAYPAITYVRFPDYIKDDIFHYRFPQLLQGGRKVGWEIIYGTKSEFGGNYGRFRGRVIDAQTEEPLVGANVQIQGSAKGAATNQNGEFFISAVDTGSYRVIVGYVGYEPVKTAIVKSEMGKTTTINFYLTAETVRNVGEVLTLQGLGITSEKTSSVGYAVAADIEEPPRAAPVALNEVVVRRNLNETAFFYPHLLTDKEGVVRLEFTMPEALTGWKFMGFAHGKECENGMVTGYTVTKKDLMVEPNAPRFLREGDTISFTAKVVNMSDRQQNGSVQVNFKDLNTELPLNTVLLLSDSVQSFATRAHGSETFSWRLFIPQGTGPLSYTVAAKSDSLSDGEAGAVPVLSSRIFLTESLPLDIRGPDTKHFIFERLKTAGKSKTLEPFRFTVQMASNPTWYAIRALPYLMEFPYECSEQIFNRLYANSLAGYIVNSDPRISDVFSRWRATGALKSNLEKNQELKSVMLMETPWVTEAKNETEAQQAMASLFEQNTLASNLGAALDKLRAWQRGDGSWPWFPGGDSDTYITLYIATGFGRLKHLGVRTDPSLAFRAVDYLDNWMKRMYDGRDTSKNNMTPTVALYLYCRSFSLAEHPLVPYVRPAFNYFVREGAKHWLDLNSLLCQGQLSLALQRIGDTATARNILASIKERSIHNDEMGMFWDEGESSWWWYRAPIETQALMIEAFEEVTRDTAAVEDCKVWLLKQEQTQNWRTTKSTADAVYALVLRGTHYLAQTTTVELKLGDQKVQPENLEAGTGFYEKVFYGSGIKPRFSDISVAKEDKGIAWGAAHFQYFEEMRNVTPHATHLKLEKKLFVKSDTKKGKVIEPVSGPLNVGDLITVRITLRVDRDMEYVHMKDMRGSGLEPVDVLSQYRYQDGLSYYQSTKDAATHFFIGYLPKGTYVFEYDLRVQLKGRYQNGVAEIQCMYAPEFNSHSESRDLVVQ